MWKDCGLRSFLSFGSSSSCVWVHIAPSFINTRCWWLTSPYLRLHLELRVWTPAHRHLHRLPEGISTFLSGSHIFGQVLWEGGRHAGSLLGPPLGSKPIGVRWHMIGQMERLSYGALTTKAPAGPMEVLESDVPSRGWFCPMHTSISHSILCFFAKHIILCYLYFNGIYFSLK